jgi:uncharacterized protein YndB with AHSA1/START domain
MTDSEFPLGPGYGVLERGEGTVTVRFTREFPHAPQKVWRALTEPEHLAAWFPTTIEGDLAAAGTPLRFSFRQVAIEPMNGHAIACEPPKVLEYLWGDETLRFELRPAGSGTTLEFTATFAEIGKAARDAAGWHACLDDFGYSLDGRDAPVPSDVRWRQVNPRYVARFGPDASTEGPPQEWTEAYGPA